MNTFFSGTDTKELEDNAANYNYYVSLIVNFDGKYCCKIAIPGKRKMTSVIELIDTEGKPYTKSQEIMDDIIFVGDLDVIHGKEIVGEDWLVAKIAELKAAKIAKQVSPRVTHAPYHLNDYSDRMDYVQPTLWDKLPRAKDKKWSDPTPREFLAELVTDCPKGINKLDMLDWDMEESCTDVSKGRVLLDFIVDNIYEVYEEIYCGDTRNVVANMESLLTELQTYKEKNGTSEFYKDFEKLLTLEIDELKQTDTV
jgi:hypothetical protein